MLKNQIKIAFRVLKKEKLFMMINVLGLALGMWCCFIIVMWVQDEFKQDAFHENRDQLCEVLRNVVTENGSIHTEQGTAFPIGDALVENIPEIKAMAKLTSSENMTIAISKELIEVKVAAASLDMFKLFSFPLVQGDPNECLSNLNNIVISEKIAKNYFEDGNLLGKTIEISVGPDKIPFVVSGVFKKIPTKSSIQFDVVIPIDNYLPFNSTYKSWGNSWLKTYVLLNDHVSLDKVNQKISDLPGKIADVKWFKLLVQPFKDRYLYSKFENGKVSGGRIDTIILFSIIAIFTLLIACFNFINLTTAWSIKRLKEVGIKKVMGAGKNRLMTQFIIESMILVLFALVLTIGFTELSLPFFNDVASKQLSVNYSDVNMYAILFGIGILTILLSGLYPAYFLSNFHPISALQGKVKGTMNQGYLRRGLVVVQFCLAMIMMGGTVVVYLQLNYIQNKNLGLDKENIIYTPLDSNTYAHSKEYKDELLKFQGIKQVSSSSGNFIDPGGSSSDPTWEGKSEISGKLWFSILDVDFNQMQLLDIDILKGRLFSRDFATDTLNYLINEEAAKLMGMNDPIGKSLSFWGEEGGKIIGVVKNFHFTTLHNPIAPMIIRGRPMETDLVYVKTLPGKTKESLAYMQTIHEKFSSLPFTYKFLDETIGKGYKEERKIQKLVGIFSLLAIFISCLGLFGLASFSANQRIKEIAVRKVLGASSFRLFNLLSKEYVVLIAISCVIATPLAWYFMNSWIQNFTYRINIHWWMFGIALLIILIIALFTVSYQSIKSAKNNPINGLRTE